MPFWLCRAHYKMFIIINRVDRNKYQIHIPLPPKIDPSVTMMQVEEKPDVTYSDVGGCKEQIEKLREVVETPLLHVRLFPCLGANVKLSLIFLWPFHFNSLFEVFFMCCF